MSATTRHGGTNPISSCLAEYERVPRTAAWMLCAALCACQSPPPQATQPPATLQSAVALPPPPPTAAVSRAAAVSATAAVSPTAAVPPLGTTTASEPAVADSCIGRGSFDLDALSMKAACELTGAASIQAMRTLEAGAGLPPGVKAELGPASGRHAKSKAPFSVDLRLRNTGPGAVDMVLFVSPDASYTLSVHPANAPEAWTNLVVARGPGFGTAVTRASWIIKVRFAGGAIGHSQIAAKALTTVSEHQGAPNGTMMRWVVVEQPLPLGEYALRVTDMIRGEAVATTKPRWLTIEP